MVTNEAVLLDEVLTKRQAERSAPIRDDDAFELFACELALRDRDMSADEVADGVVGGGNDGGIDGIYLFLDNSPLSDDSDVLAEDFVPGSVAVGVVLELWLVQAKRESSFTETAIEKVADSARRLLSLAEDDESLLKLYSSPVVGRTGMFRSALRALATRHPAVRIRFVYASKGETGQINQKVQTKADDLKEQLSQVVSGCFAEVEFMGAAELWHKISTIPSYTMQLTYQENATSGSSHVALVSLREYLTFLVDEQGELQRHIFDWNVRDYQGNVEVNREIRGSLETLDSPEFWWLNNGVTIVCSKASVIGRTYSLDNVQVVNGLQTSETIFNILSTAESSHPSFDRAILVRILVTGDDLVVRDQVIRATNRQTSVPAASLRATDNVQRDIEAYFSSHGWFYDRRKNFHRNNGRSPERIVGIPYLAQAVMAMGLSRPDDSRARPSSLLKRDDDYKELFSSKTPLELYLWLAESQKTVDTFMLSETANLTAQDRTNLRFHVAMIAAAKIAGVRIYAPAQLASAITRPITDADLAKCLELTRACFESFQTETGDGADKVAKGREFVERLHAFAAPFVAEKDPS